MFFRRHPPACKCGAKVDRPGDRCPACLELEDWRKVLAFASSAGTTLSVLDALDMIRELATLRVGVHNAALVLAAARARGELPS